MTVATGATGMTKGERDDLARLIRHRERLLKTAASQRAAELLADFETPEFVEQLLATVSIAEIWL